MPKLGRREYYLFNISDKNLESLIDVIKSTLTLPPKYSVDVYSGKYGLNVIIEISGPDEGKIKKIDLEICAKVLEICERGGIAAHVMEPLEII